MPKSKKEINNYIDQFKREKYDRLVILTPKGTKETIQNIPGYTSVSAFVNAAIAEKLLRELSGVAEEPDAPSSSSDANQQP